MRRGANSDAKTLNPLWKVDFSTLVVQGYGSHGQCFPDRGLLSVFPDPAGRRSFPGTYCRTWRALRRESQAQYLDQPPAVGDQPAFAGFLGRLLERDGAIKQVSLDQVTARLIEIAATESIPVLGPRVTLDRVSVRVARLLDTTGLIRGYLD